MIAHVSLGMTRGQVQAIHPTLTCTFLPGRSELLPPMTTCRLPFGTGDIAGVHPSRLNVNFDEPDRVTSVLAFFVPPFPPEQVERIHQHFTRAYGPATVISDAWILIYQWDRAGARLMFRLPTGASKGAELELWTPEPPQP
jgi:hypothetical protein